MNTFSKLIFIAFISVSLASCSGSGNSSTGGTTTPTTTAGTGGSTPSTASDTTPPIITLLGTNPYSIVQGATYVDAGATALDNVDGNLTSSITINNSVNTSVIGTYQVTYNVSDLSSNAATQAVRTVNVIAATTTPATSGRLNDTGVNTWSTDIAKGLNTAQPSFPNQDADVGRDALATAGTLIKVGGGHAGFDFTKLDAAGNPLANQAATYATTPWSCVKDNATGFMWEVKTTAGAGGLRDANHTYSWYVSSLASPIGVSPGGVANGGVCVDTVNCDTEKYIAAVNAMALCGFSDWRLPKRETLHSIVDYGTWNPAIDTNYFPNTTTTNYYLSSSYALLTVWQTGFKYGAFVNGFKSSAAISVRLVR